MSGYTPCACRDCMELAISSDVKKPELCHACKRAGCDGGECQAPYSDDPGMEITSMNAKQIIDASTLADSYFETMLWSSSDNATDDGGEPLDANYSADDIAQDDKAAQIAQLASFLSNAQQYLTTAQERDTVAHDFWLTRNGHGAGFWDGNYVYGDVLTALAKLYGECDPYVGDDGKLYISGGHIPTSEQLCARIAAKEAPRA